MLKTIEIADKTIPAIAIPVGAPPAILFFLPIIPRIKPAIAAGNPNPMAAATVREAIPRIRAANDWPLPGTEPGFA